MLSCGFFSSDPTKSTTYPKENEQEINCKGNEINLSTKHSESYFSCSVINQYDFKNEIIETKLVTIEPEDDYITNMIFIVEMSIAGVLMIVITLYCFFAYKAQRKDRKKEYNKYLLRK